eukprot:TRINITY_DN31406_c0_g1_i1.p2 TRINITY_DN31406_c0_g1~~TRINITY_DN31406_c0_g1_i1.p2  ORF type:complete len:234 (-),score=28.23 TRINITY_DN31406_c0_g1_i1:375-1076(-)
MDFQNDGSQKCSPSSRTRADSCSWASSSSEDFDMEPLKPLKATQEGLKVRRERRRRLNSLHCYAARTGVAAVTASAVILSSQFEGLGETTQTPEDMDADVQSSLSGGAGFTPLSKLTGVLARFAAQLCELIRNLVDSLGAPPRRAPSEDEIPTKVLLAIDIGILCVVASLILVVWAFWSMPMPAPQTPLEPPPKQLFKYAGKLRIMGWISLSFVAGSALSVRHPLQSALLCGV